MKRFYTSLVLLLSVALLSAPIAEAKLRAVAGSSGGGGSGDVTSAASIDADAIVRGDNGVKGVQESVVFIGDTGDITGVGTLASGAHTITSSSANSLAVGPNGSTNPALQVDASTASLASGISVTGRATGTGPLMASIGSGANQPFTITTKGTGALNLQSAGTGAVALRPAGATTASFTSSLSALTTQTTVTLTDTSTDFDDFGDPGKALTTKLNYQPASNTTAVRAGTTCWLNHDGANDITGSGHIIGCLGIAEVNNASADVPLVIGTEGRAGVKAGTASVVAGLVGTLNTNTEDAGTATYGVGLYIPTFTDQGQFSNVHPIFSAATQTSVFQGPIQGAAGQQLAGAGSTDSARYLGPMGANDIAALGAGGVAMSAGQMYCTKISVPRSGTLDSIQVEVITDSGGDLRLGVYNDANGLPGTILEDGGALAVTGTGIKTDTLTAAVQAGIYWGCVAVQTSNLTIDFDIVMNYHELYGLDASRTAGQAAALQTGVTGALPSPFTGTITATSTLTPGIGISMN